MVTFVSFLFGWFYRSAMCYNILKFSCSFFSFPSNFAIFSQPLGGNARYNFSMLLWRNKIYKKRGKSLFSISFTLSVFIHKGYYAKFFREFCYIEDLYGHRLYSLPLSLSFLYILELTFFLVCVAWFGVFGWLRVSFIVQFCVQ